MKTLLIALMTITTLSQAFGQTSVETINILGKDNFTEGLAYSAKLKKTYVSSAIGGSIQVINDKGEASWFSKDDADGRAKAHGMKVDDKRNRLWIAGDDGVYIYNTVTKKLIKKIPLESAGDYGDSFLNDLVLDKNGSAYITDSFSPNLFHVDAETLQLKHFADMSSIPWKTKDENPWNLNGIVISPNGEDLIVGKTNDGTLWKVNIKTKTIRQIKTSTPLKFVDGLTWGDNGELFLIRNFANTISKIDYLSTDEVKKVTDLNIDKKNFLIPTNAIYFNQDGKKQLLVVNAQFVQEDTRQSFLTKINL